MQLTIAAMRIGGLLIMSFVLSKERPPVGSGRSGTERQCSEIRVAENRGPVGCRRFNNAFKAATTDFTGVQVYAAPLLGVAKLRDFITLPHETVWLPA